MKDGAEKDATAKNKAEAFSENEDKKAAEKTAEPSKKNSKGRKRKVDKKAAEIDALKDRLLRLQADFDNFRKRTLREKGELRKRANEDLMLELLPALDHMELALKSATEHDAPDAFTEGFRLVLEQIQGALAKSGLSPIDADGEEFDFNKHEAISHIPSDDIPENHVVTQTRRGYMLGEFLLRAAQVVVSSGPLPTEAAEEDSEETEA